MNAGQDDALDDAIETAADRARKAEERLAQKGPESPEIVQEAHTVYRRTEDLHELATDAAEEAERGG